MKVTGVIYVDTIADLKASPIAPDAMMFVKGNQNIGDGLGGFYMWDATSTNTEDTQYLNYIKATDHTTGRWVRLFQRARVQNTGVMVNTGGVKAYYISGTTDANGNVTLNLTEDGTANGVALFSDIWAITTYPQVNANGPADAVQSYRKSLSANKKNVTYGFYKANALTVTLGLLFVPVTSIGAGTVISFKVEGI